MTEVEVSQTTEVSGDTLEDHVRAAKSYLLSSGNGGITVYDHLVNMLTKILEVKPINPVDTFEEISNKEKKSRFYTPADTIQDRTPAATETILAHEQKTLFDRKPDLEPEPLDIDDEEEEEIINEVVLQDIMENAYYFEQAGVGLGREETFRIFLALKQLTDTYNLLTCRFWGKILGTEGNYIIAEVVFKEGQDNYQDIGEEESDSVLDKLYGPPRMNTHSMEILSGELQEQAEYEALPKPDFKPPPVIPKEGYGEGTNAKVYFVCNDAGQSWHRLPPVTPEQIAVSRQIRKLVTGRLEEEVISYPPFPGNEANYLRAQIARITSATQVSPQGYYIFEEDDEDEDAVRDTIMPNQEFEGIPVSDLVDPSLGFWVHHMPAILPQGRTTWWNPLSKGEEEEIEEEEDEDEREEPDEMEPEEGPPLLSPLSEDTEVNGMEAWTPSKSTSLVSQYAIAVLHSNLWPGAHVFAVDKKFENIYIGYGLKYSADNYSPPVPPAALEEYPSGPEITEADDPTVEQERALKAAQMEAMEAAEEEEESDEYEEED